MLLPFIIMLANSPDLRDAFLSAEDFERGARAADLVSIDVARLWDRPVDDVRRRLRIAPRVRRPRSHANTCGGVPFPFWQCDGVPKTRREEA